MEDIKTPQSATCLALETPELLTEILLYLDTIHDIFLGARGVSTFWKSVVDTTPRILYNTFRWDGNFEQDFFKSLPEPGTVNFDMMSEVEKHKFEEEVLSRHEFLVTGPLSNRSYADGYAQHVCIKILPMLHDLDIHMEVPQPEPSTGQPSYQKNSITQHEEMPDGRNILPWIRENGTTKLFYATRPMIKLVEIYFELYQMGYSGMWVGDRLPDAYNWVGTVTNDDGVNAEDMYKFFERFNILDIWPIDCDETGAWLELHYLKAVKGRSPGHVGLYWDCDFMGKYQEDIEADRQRRVYGALSERRR